MRTEEVERAQKSTSISTILPIPPSLTLKLIDNESWFPGKNGTYGYPIPNPSGSEAIVSDR